MPKRESSSTSLQYRFGIGEWYGKSYVDLDDRDRERFIAIQNEEDPADEIPDCPFADFGPSKKCTKPGGVCSLRLYQKSGVPQTVEPDPRGSTLRVTCPARFREDSEVFKWISETILDTSDAIPIGEVSFLERVPLAGGKIIKEDKEGVGRIDNVLIVPNSDPLQWCPVEIQAVYFSGRKMQLDFDYMISNPEEHPIFPTVIRRPDYRSSGPKRLMPQLQIKVPTLRRWGKKMAVVIDEDFFNNMGVMTTVGDLSNCDVAWFVVRFHETEAGFKLARGDVHFTTLEASVEALVAGKPVSQSKFEKRIISKLSDSRPG